MPARAKTFPRDRELHERVLRRARRGDPDAFRDLVECYHRPVHALLWRMVEPTLGRARAEDLAQETFLRVYRALPRFRTDGPARLSSWILTIATRLALNELRRASRREVGWDDVDERELASPPRERPDLAMDRRRLGRELRQAIAALPPTFRAALVLREYHGLDYASIAGALETSRGTVKSRIARARARVRAHLEEASDG